MDTAPGQHGTGGEGAEDRHARRARALESLGEASDERAPPAQPPPQVAVPAAPPTVPGSMVSTRRAAWPAVFGVLIVVVSSLGALGSLGGALSMWINTMMFGAMPAGPGSPEAMAEATARYAWPMTLASLFELLVNVLGIAAGIGLMMRKPWTPGAGVAWAWLKLLASSVRAAVTCLYSVATTTAMMNDPQMQAAPMGSGFGTMMIVMTVGMTVVFTVVWNWTLPVLLLWWLSRPASKEEVASWGGPEGADPRQTGGGPVAGSGAGADAGAGIRAGPAGGEGAGGGAGG